MSDDGGNSNKGGTKGDNPPVGQAQTPSTNFANDPIMPNVGTTPTAGTTPGIDVTNLPTVDNTNFDHLNAPGGTTPMADIAGKPGPGTGFDLTNPTGRDTAPGGALPPGVSPPGATQTGTTSTTAKPPNDIMTSLGIKNPVGTAVGLGGLGFAMAQGQTAPKFTPEMQQQAAQLNQQGQQLLSFLQNGNLPPGLKEQLTQATSAAKAKIVSNFAAQGLSTDPTQNSVLAQQLAQVDQQALISTAQIGQQLMTAGMAETGLASDLFKTLANIDQTQTANIGKAIASFAAATAGTTPGINLKLA